MGMGPERNMSKVAVVTGAGAGVGRATAVEFAKRGYDVGLLSRDPGRLQSAAEDVERYGVRALKIPTDVADAKAVEAAADRIEQELGPDRRLGQCRDGDRLRARQPNDA